MIRRVILAFCIITALSLLGTIVYAALWADEGYLTWQGVLGENLISAVLCDHIVEVNWRHSYVPGHELFAEHAIYKGCIDRMRTNRKAFREGRTRVHRASSEHCRALHEASYAMFGNHVTYRWRVGVREGCRMARGDGPYFTFLVSYLVCPVWLPLVPLLAYPTVAFVRGPVRRFRRRRRGLCLQCGYKLTGNVTGICPECGTMFATTRKGQNYEGNRQAITDRADGIQRLRRVL